MLDAYEAVVDGVPVFWVESDLPVLTASLRFRAGQIDERLPERGHLHLLEHLAFHDLQVPPRVTYSGAVTPLFTTFTFSGPPAEVARLLGELAGRLGDVGDDALQHEARVLTQEARIRGGASLDTTLLYRWGAQGPGVLWFREFGLNRPDPHVLRATARRCFVRQNAVLSLDGPIPDKLEMPLTEGDLQPIRLPRHPRPLPAAAPDDRTAITGLAPSGLASEITLAIVAGRLNQGLRTGAGAPDWQASSLLLGDTTHLALVVPEDEQATGHANAALRVLRSLAEQGPAAAELTEYRIQQEQERLDPDAAWAAPWQEAQARLLGRPRRTSAAWRAELDEVTGWAVSRVAQAWLASVLVTVPDRAQAPAGLPWIFDADPPATTPSGARVTTLVAPDSEGTRLCLDGHVLQLGTLSATVTLDLADLALYGVNPDGQRLLIGVGGDRVVFEPGIWRDGSRIQQALDDAVPAAPRIPLEPRPTEEVPHTPGRAERAAAQWHRIRMALTRGEVLYPVILGAGLIGLIVWLGLAGMTVPAAWLGFVGALFWAVTWMRSA